MHKSVKKKERAQTECCCGEHNKHSHTAIQWQDCWEKQICWLNNNWFFLNSQFQRKSWCQQIDNDQDWIDKIINNNNRTEAKIILLKNMKKFLQNSKLKKKKEILSNDEWKYCENCVPFQKSYVNHVIFVTSFWNRKDIKIEKRFWTKTKNIILKLIVSLFVPTRSKIFHPNDW